LTASIKTTASTHIASTDATTSHHQTTKTFSDHPFKTSVIHGVSTVTAATPEVSPRNMPSNSRTRGDAPRNPPARATPGRSTRVTVRQKTKTIDETPDALLREQTPRRILSHLRLSSTSRFLSSRSRVLGSVTKAPIWADSRIPPIITGIAIAAAPADCPEPSIPAARSGPSIPLSNDPANP